MIRLHHIPGSRSMRVLWLLEELGLEAEIREWSLTDGSLRSPEFRALSPAARVPALEVDGTVIFESGAIVQWLTEREGRLAPAPGSAERAEFLGWLHFAETQGHILQSLNIQHNFLRPETARSPVMMKLETRRLALTAEALNAHLAGREALLASGFSAADCMMGFNIDALPRFLRLEGLDHLQAYIARMEARTAYQSALRKGGKTLFEKDFHEVPHV